jgi:acyl-[acyl-carrier-protein]-phospholipid O-acyltransferase/long-chain-fatty-acid--[acyl-carrier-protein] ligase
VKKFLDLFGVIPISPAAGKDALQTVRTYLLDGEVVALFPEGRISRNGHLSTFQKGFELAVTGTGVPIIPFYIRGLWGSLYSFATKKYRRNSMRGRVRDIRVSFGSAMPETTGTAYIYRCMGHLCRTARSRPHKLVENGQTPQR